MGAVFGVFAGFYYWAPKIIGRACNEVLGKIHFWTTMIGVDQKKYFSNNSFNLNYNVKFIYYNLLINKSKIYKDIKNKAEVYCLVNNINGNTYIGSSINLYKRIVEYYSRTCSTKLTNSIIIKALKKYGLNNFSLIIFDFCEPIYSECRKLEQLAFNIFKPIYNILTIAGSSKGFKHSEETKLLLSKLFTGRNHPMFGKTQNIETILSRSLSLKNKFTNCPHHNKGKKGEFSPQYGIGGKTVYLYDVETRELVKCFPSMNSAIKYIHVRVETLFESINLGLLIKNKWLASFNPLLSNDQLFEKFILPTDVPEKARVKGFKLYIYDLETKILVKTYSSIRQMAREEHVNQLTIRNCLINNKIF
jgi:group I intron endonuclease